MQRMPNASNACLYFKPIPVWHVSYQHRAMRQFVTSWQDRSYPINQFGDVAAVSVVTLNSITAVDVLIISSECAINGMPNQFTDG